MRVRSSTIEGNDIDAISISINSSINSINSMYSVSIISSSIISSKRSDNNNDVVVIG